MLHLRLASHFWGNRAARFVAVGIVNTLFSYSVYAALILVGVEYHAALTVSTILGVIFNFKSTGTLVFHNRENRLIFRFLLVYAVVYAVNQLSLTLLVTADVHKLMAQALLLPFIVLFTYSLQKNFVFGRNPVKS